MRLERRHLWQVMQRLLTAISHGVKSNIAANKVHFWDCCSNVGHFLCGVAKVKRYVNVYLHLCF